MTPRGIAFALVASVVALTVAAVWYMDSLPRRERRKEPADPRAPEPPEHEGPVPEYAVEH